MWCRSKSGGILEEELRVGICVAGRTSFQGAKRLQITLQSFQRVLFASASRLRLFVDEDVSFIVTELFENVISAKMFDMRSPFAFLVRYYDALGIMRVRL